MKFLTFKLQRVYEKKLEDGYHALVDRVWPRGVKKSFLTLDGWWKELTPTTQLRQWFNHDSKKWEEFAQKYLEQLKSYETAARARIKEASSRFNTAILLYAAKDPFYFHAKILKNYLENLI